MRINIKAIPNAKSVSISANGEADYSIRIDAPAHEGKANKRLIEILSDYFKIPKSHVKIIKGASAKSKVVEIDI
ncbi:MAG: DUF167 domain-containing protein [Candidatus Marsarchaeota archaeon]|nr:DUF167 domain-containing protein [Candidatus Marsarchaeota archaeon]